MISSKFIQDRISPDLALVKTELNDVKAAVADGITELKQDIANVPTKANLSNAVAGINFTSQFNEVKNAIATSAASASSHLDALIGVPAGSTGPVVVVGGGKPGASAQKHVAVKSLDPTYVYTLNADGYAAISNDKSFGKLEFITLERFATISFDKSNAFIPTSVDMPALGALAGSNDELASVAQTLYGLLKPYLIVSGGEAVGKSSDLISVIGEIGGKDPNIDIAVSLVDSFTDKSGVVDYNSLQSAVANSDSPAIRLVKSALTEMTLTKSAGSGSGSGKPTTLFGYLTDQATAATAFQTATTASLANVTHAIQNTSSDINYINDTIQNLNNVIGSALYVGGGKVSAVRSLQADAGLVQSISAGTSDSWSVVSIVPSPSASAGLPRVSPPGPRQTVAPVTVMSQLASVSNDSRFNTMVALLSLLPGAIASIQTKIDADTATIAATSQKIDGATASLHSGFYQDVAINQDAQQALFNHASEAVAIETAALAVLKQTMDNAKTDWDTKLNAKTSAHASEALAETMKLDKLSAVEALRGTVHETGNDEVWDAAIQSFVAANVEHERCLTVFNAAAAAELIAHALYNAASMAYNNSPHADLLAQAQEDLATSTHELQLITDAMASRLAADAPYFPQSVHSASDAIDMLNYGIMLATKQLMVVQNEVSGLQQKLAARQHQGDILRSNIQAAADPLFDAYASVSGTPIGGVLVKGG